MGLAVRKVVGCGKVVSAGKGVNGKMGGKEFENENLKKRKERKMVEEEREWQDNRCYGVHELLSILA